MEQKYFTEKEAVKFVQLAAQLQEREAEKGGDYTPGVSIDELRRIAREAGIDPKFIDQAIAGQGPANNQKRLPWSEVEKVIEGEINPDDYDVIHDAIGRGMRRYPLRQVGRSLEGSTLEGGTMNHIGVTSRGGRTRITVRPSIFPAFFLTAYPIGLMGSIFGAVLAETMGASPAPFIGGSIALGLGLFGFVVSRAQKTAQTIASRIEASVRDVVDQPREEGPRVRALRQDAPVSEMGPDEVATLGQGGTS